MRGCEAGGFGSAVVRIETQEFAGVGFASRISRALK